MKDKIMAAALLVFAVFGVSAQSRGPDFRGDPGRGPEQVTVTGNLSLVNGLIALESDQTTYYVAGLERLIGFIDGLKEGAAVTLEGFAAAVPGAPEYRYLRAAKLTLNGKEYQLAGPAGPRQKHRPEQGRRRYYEDRHPRGPGMPGPCGRW
jgi:hypothetical protein